MYFSLDNNLQKLSEDCDIHYIRDRGALKAFTCLVKSLLPPGNNIGWMSITIQPARFENCWKRVKTDPRSLPEGFFAPFKQEELIILAPGQHPGGPDEWWVLPARPVYVAY